MSIRVFDGASWNNQKSLQLYSGSAWAKSKSGWIYNGAAWTMFYPEYPANTVLPLISGSATQGNTLTVSNGTWNTLDAYTGTVSGGTGTLTYSYQWKSAGSNVGTNSSSYQTQLSDVGKAITCVVTAENFRGPTSATSSNSITVTSAIPSPPTGVSISDATLTPGAPSGVVVAPLAQPDGQTTANVSWNAATGTFTSYSGSATVGFLQNINPSTRTANVTNGNPSQSTTVNIFAINTNGVASVSWNASANTTSYDVYILNITDGITLGPYNTTLTSYSQSVSTGRNYQAQVYSKNAAGTSSTFGSSTTIAINQKNSGNAFGSATFNNQIIPTITNLVCSSKTDTTATLSWSSTGQAEYRIVGYTSWLSGSTTSYTLTGLTQNTSYAYTVEVRSSTLNTASQSVSFQTNVTPIVPVIGSFFVTNSNTLTYLNWTITGGNQASAVITASPATGGAGGGSSFNITNSTDRQKYVGTATTGQQYTFGITVTSTTGHTATSSVNYTYGTAPPSVPGTPTLTYVSANNTSTTWGYSATWGASTGSGTIQYQILGTGSAGGSSTLGLYSTTSASFNLSRNDTTWTIQVRATNDGGSTWSGYSGSSNSA